MIWAVFCLFAAFLTVLPEPGVKEKPLPKSLGGNHGAEVLVIHLAPHQRGSLKRHQPWSKAASMKSLRKVTRDRCQQELVRAMLNVSKDPPAKMTGETAETTWGKGTN